ncbi:MAG: hypothetical protein C4K47_04180 [Candidatus Thorarchaeota archaeon]|nr:MAG: hypothetical protein C4K47_04180 [Candidatus Thorarchaeota archaeon]
MSREIQLETSSRILNTASKYMIVSVVAVAIGCVAMVYGILAYLAYGLVAMQFAIFAGFFVGVAFVLIGVFLAFWGLYWMRNEGKRLKRMFESRG